MDTPLLVIGIVFGYSFIQFWCNCSRLSEQWEERRIRLYRQKRNADSKYWEDFWTGHDHEWNCDGGSSHA